MIISKRSHGGAREGAGRPKCEAKLSKVMTIRLKPEQKEKLVALGGAKWIRAKIESEELSNE